MLWVFWLLILLALSYGFSKWLDWRHNPNRTPLSSEDGSLRSVVLKSNDQHHYVVSGSINSQPVTFMLDTGATHVAIPERIAKRLKLQRGPEEIAMTANGPVIVHATRLDTVGIGNIVLYDVKASILPDFADDEILLGMSALKQLEFSQQGDTLTLKQRH